MSRKLISEFPTDITILWKSHIPTLSIIPVRVNAIYLQPNGNDDYSEMHWSMVKNKISQYNIESIMPKFSIELIDADGNILPKMPVEYKFYNKDYHGWSIKSNLHFTKDEAAKRLCKNIENVWPVRKREIQYTDIELIKRNLEILKSEFPHYLI